MKTAARRLPAAPIALAAALLTAFLVLFSPLSASAHDALVASSPEADSTVQTLPSELTLTFSNKLIDGEGATEVVVTDAAGTVVSDGPATVNGAVVTQGLVAEADAGAYHVVWRIVSSDGHPTSGEFSFAVAASTRTGSASPSAEPTATASAPSATSTPTTAPAADAPAEGDGVGIWLLAIIGALIVAAVIVVLLSRRGNRGTTGIRGADGASSEASDDPSAR
ncbi:copper resistance CopC family protein [Microbacterium sp. XT11]|uniref:copper resistance CopC family protein n=1 Tax=Microbacterium sp. XT11 TaxID=367477 RepID=UPI00082BEE89|nr:copper resistance CopC family protein [Microbacterium sp. XT11]